jgi:predicted dienelactone hydrolase
MLTLLLACTSAPDTAEPVTWFAPDATGDYTAISYDTVVVSQDGVELPATVWYPSTQTAQGALVEYADILPGTARSHGDAACAVTRPVVVFSHGNGGVRWQSVFLGEALARHGYVVIAPDHVGNTLLDLDTIPKEQIALRRPLDVMASFDQLLAEERVSHCVSQDDGYAVMGHSFGGFTSLFIGGATIDTDALEAECDATGIPWLCGIEDHADGVVDLRDPRAWASLPLTPAGGHTFAAGLADHAVPTLIVGAEFDELTSMDHQVFPIYDGVPEPKRLATLLGAGHFSIAGMCDQLGNVNGCGEGYAPAEDTHADLTQLVLAFLLEHRADVDYIWDVDLAGVDQDR